jgi:hypothetical protein
MPAVLKSDTVQRLARAGRIESGYSEPKTDDSAKDVAALRQEIAALQQSLANLATELTTRMASDKADHTSVMLRNALAVNERASDALVALSAAMTKEPTPEPPVPDPRGATWELRMPGTGFNAPDRVLTITRTA